MIASQLLCTFTTPELCDEIVNKIKDTYDIIYRKIFILEDITNENNLICTYNIERGNAINIIPNTIVVHRKKQSNTLYTINALNMLIKSLNNGILDKEYSINWIQYENSMILINSYKLNIVKTKINKIFS
jgi:hypothetical protein